MPYRQFGPSGWKGRTLPQQAQSGISHFLGSGRLPALALGSASFTPKMLTRQPRDSAG